MHRLSRQVLRMLLGASTFCLAALLVAGAPSQATGASLPTHVSVKPGSGNPRTRFVLSLRIPETTGTFGSVVRHDTLSVSGLRGPRCVSNATVRLRSAKRGARLTLTLRPASLGTGGWCTGEFNGRVVQHEVLRCPPRPMHVCPDFLLAPRTIARFRFHVAPDNAGGSPGSGPAPADRPAFAGLVSATTCNSFPPAVLPRPSGYTLTWQAATDPVTASSAIVYDIYVATAPGGENYAQPTWTTQPGVTSFTTPAQTRSGPILYFVVRARNTAGNEDDNTVERQGVTQCGGPARIQPAAA